MGALSLALATEVFGGTPGIIRYYHARMNYVDEDQYFHDLISLLIDDTYAVKVGICVSFYSSN